MEPEVTTESVKDASDIDESVSFPHVSAVAAGWIVDFMFVSLCRHFREGQLDEFNETLSAYKEISQSPSLKGAIYDKKIMIMAFLARIMHGKELDVEFEEDKHVTPLMSAANIWSDLEDAVEDESVFKDITILLFVQAVAVCLEKGETSSASFALKWFKNNHEFPQNLGVKLSTIVTQGETYHPFLMSFSFKRLLDTVRSFLDAYLKKNPSDYLLKAATKMVQSTQNTEGLEDMYTSQDRTLSETDTTSTVDRKENRNTFCLKTKRKLMSTKMTDVWKPDSCKKPFVSVPRIPSHDNVYSPPPSEDPRVSRVPRRSYIDTSTVRKTRKAPEKWTPELDKYLKNGVMHHGHGKWSRILMDYDFKGRTGVMLKDRWRILKRSNQVD